MELKVGRKGWKDGIRGIYIGKRRPRGEIKRMKFIMGTTYQMIQVLKATTTNYTEIDTIFITIRTEV